MSSSTFSPGEVAIGERLHSNTSKKVGELRDSTYVVEVEAKRRPVLVFGEAGKFDLYPVFDFTTQRPENGHPNFVLQENGKPKSFGARHGFSKVSYLCIYPSNQVPGNRLAKSPIDTFSREALNAFLLQHLHRLQQA